MTSFFVLIIGHRIQVEVNVAGMAVLKWAGWAAACLVELREELIANQASESWE